MPLPSAQGQTDYKRADDIAKRLVITTGTKKGQHPSPATIMRMLREHDEQAAVSAST